ncbi:MAG: hypothetical protein LBB09_01555 [Rickettsiales bacterium]|jgi:hypothetical protein|nr:hypothetical protein [Rickettsiales bacterium]
MRKRSKFFSKILGNPAIKRARELSVRIYKNFKPTIAVILALTAFLCAKSAYDRRFGYSKLLDVLEGGGKYVGNAVYFRDEMFITIYDNLISTCVKRKTENKIHYFIVLDGELYGVFVDAADPERNLAILKINRLVNQSQLPGGENYYILFSSDNMLNYIGKDVFISKRLNSPSNYFLKKYRVKEISNLGFAVKSFDNARNNIGEVALNDRLEVVGITVGNTKKGFLGKFSNRIEFIDLVKIKNFLLSRKMYYLENKTNIDLSRVKDYLKFMNAKVICAEESVRIPLIIQRRR